MPEFTAKAKLLHQAHLDLNKVADNLQIPYVYSVMQMLEFDQNFIVCSQGRIDNNYGVYNLENCLTYVISFYLYYPLLLFHTTRSSVVDNIIQR